MQDSNGVETEQSIVLKKKIIRHPDFCFYCETDVLNFARHLKRNHPMEIEVNTIKNTLICNTSN